LIVFVLLVECSALNNHGFCQKNNVPTPVTNKFIAMFPEARNIEWRDKLTDYQVFFMANNAKCEAKFSLDGKWISTEKQINNDSIPEKIKEGLRSGKYSEWNIQSVFKLIFPDKPVQYHLVITKDDLPKKILFFNETGEIIQDNLSL
jgi:hypothetical protein